MKQEYFDNLPEEAKDFLNKVRINPSDDGELKFAFGDKPEYQTPPDDLMKIIEHTIHAYTVYGRFKKAYAQLHGKRLGEG